MIKKTLLLSAAFFGLFFSLSILFQSCGCEEKVCSFKFQAYDFYKGTEDSLNTNWEDGIDTSLNKMNVYFALSHDVVNPACAWQNIGFNSAYAFTQYCEVTNAIISDSYFLKLDRDLVFNTTTIPAGTNLVTDPSLKDHWTIESREGFKGSQLVGSILLDSAITQMIQFDTGAYELEFGLSTDDGQNLNGNLDVIYKL